MGETALKLYKSLSNFREVESLIDQGESEGLYLECKSPDSSNLSKELKNKLAQNISAFSNTEGGVIIWGVSTTRHAHTGLDILNQIEPIGSCKRFLKQIETSIPSLTTPPITNCLNKILVKKTKDTRGIIITYIPKLESDPVQAIFDQNFYFRSGGECIKMPYEMLKRLFAATSMPDLHCVFPMDIIKKETSKDKWEIPIVISNQSSAAASDIKVSVQILNPDSCQEIYSKDLRDASNVNPGNKIFMSDIKGVIHKGLDSVVGTIFIKLKAKKRNLKIKIILFANNMRARKFNFSLKLIKKGFSIESSDMDFIY